jgi:hypothetical protein
VYGTIYHIGWGRESAHLIFREFRRRGEAGCLIGC